jgi:hypothetical protein
MLSKLGNKMLSKKKNHLKKQIVDGRPAVLKELISK